MISAEDLVKAMERSGVTPQRLADELGISKQYINDIVKGRRTLKRNPLLRKRIAAAIDVPQHWIERGAA